MTAEQVEDAVARDDAEQLRVAVLAAALHGEDRRWAEQVCATLARHRRPAVRGCAILGLGHIARIHRELDLELAVPLIEAAFADSDEYVRGQADAAADDIEHYLGRPINRGTRHLA